jgi:hypothetical protein
VALIPPDAGIRMRMQTEANLLQPVAPAHEIPSDLPELQTGQTFTARIQEVLPDNSYRALVAGKQLTLQLPEGAKVGDQLELVVIDRSARAVIAKQVEGSAIAPGEPGAYEFAKFSPAARMIGQLLPAEGESPSPAPLNRGQPLLPQPPQSQAAAVQLAPTLTKAVANSGLFYEAHQARWVTGDMPLEQLLQEPQGQRSSPNAFQHAAAEAAAHAISTRDRPVTPEAILQALQGQGSKVGAGETATSSSLPAQPTVQTGTAAPQVPEELRPLVQQQLEAVATQRLFWHGEVWPRQAMDWQIEWQNEREADASEDESLRWATTVALTTPRLGRVDAKLQLSTTGVHITLSTPYGASAADLRDESPKLAGALSAAGVPLLSFHVKHEDEQPSGQE